MTKQKRSELMQDEIICPHCNEVQDSDFLKSQDARCIACDWQFFIQVIQRPNLYITKPYNVSTILWDS